MLIEFTAEGLYASPGYGRLTYVRSIYALRLPLSTDQYCAIPLPIVCALTAWGQVNVADVPNRERVPAQPFREGVPEVLPSDGGRRGLSLQIQGHSCGLSAF